VPSNSKKEEDETVAKHDDDGRKTRLLRGHTTTTTPSCCFAHKASFCDRNGQAHSVATTATTTTTTRTRSFAAAGRTKQQQQEGESAAPLTPAPPESGAPPENGSGAGEEGEVRELILACVAVGRAKNMGIAMNQVWLCFYAQHERVSSDFFFFALYIDSLLLSC
jgi:hypothetical protein